LCGPDERAKRKQPAGADGLDHRRRWSLCPPRREEFPSEGGFESYPGEQMLSALSPKADVGRRLVRYLWLRLNEATS
jgi:hypothetical protein